MKKYLIIFSLISCYGFSQNLDFKEIIELQSKPHDSIKKLLLNKNWVIIQNLGSEEFPFGDTRFAFDDNSGNRKNSFFIGLHYYKNNPKKNIVKFEIPFLEQYQKYIDDLKQNGYEKTSSNSNVNESWEIYQNSKFYVEMVIMPVENYFGVAKTFYYLIVTDKNVSNPLRRK